MWPWEHLALGYLGTSVIHRLVTGRGLDTAGAVAVVLGTQTPDLIDKPLAWSLDVLPSGLSLGHSLTFAIPASAAVVLVARRFDRTRLGLLFALAYGSHLFGDVLFGLATGGSLALGFLFWPFVPASPDPGVGLLTRVGQLARGFRTFLSTPTGQLYLLFDTLLLGSALLLWLIDGRPGLPRLRAPDRQTWRW